MRRDLSGCPIIKTLLSRVTQSMHACVKAFMKLHAFSLAGQITRRPEALLTLGSIADSAAISLPYQNLACFQYSGHFPRLRSYIFSILYTMKACNLAGKAQRGCFTSAKPSNVSAAPQQQLAIDSLTTLAQQASKGIIMFLFTAGECEAQGCSQCQGPPQGTA